MHQTGVFFLNSLLGLHGIEAPDTYESLEIERQYMGLDILVLVNRDIAVLIEDKTASSEHTDQLERYLKAVRADYPSRMLAPVYLKIRNQACLKAVIDAGWQCFLRHDLLRVLAYGNRQGVKNDIFTHYHARLLRLDRKWWRQRAITNIPPQQSRFD